MRAGGWRGGLGTAASALIEAVGRLRSHRSNLAAAGSAFYATLALFPALSLLLGLYGLAFNLHTVEPQLRMLDTFIPGEVQELVVGEVRALVLQHHPRIGLGAALGALLALWSVLTGTRAMLAALTQAYESEEQPRAWRLELTGLAITLVALVATSVALALVVSLPVALRYWGLPPRVLLPLHGLSLGLLTALVGAFFAALYSFGPPLRRGEVRIAWPGTVLATLIWLIASGLFSAYVAGLAAHGSIYGPLGAVAALMLWFYVSAWVLLLGAEFNAALERRAVSESIP